MLKRSKILFAFTHTFRTTYQSKVKPPNTYHTLLAVTKSSASAKPSARSSSACAARWWCTAATTARSSCPCASSSTPSRSSTCWRARIRWRSWSTPSRTRVHAKTRPVSVAPVPSDVRPSMFPRWGALTRPSGSCALVSWQPKQPKGDECGSVKFHFNSFRFISIH